MRIAKKKVIKKAQKGFIRRIILRIFARSGLSVCVQYKMQCCFLIFFFVLPPSLACFRNIAYEVGGNLLPYTLLPVQSTSKNSETFLFSHFFFKEAASKTRWIVLSHPSALPLPPLLPPPSSPPPPPQPVVIVLARWFVMCTTFFSCVHVAIKFPSPRKYFATGSRISISL